MCLSVWSASGRRGATIPARPSTNSPHPRAGGEGAGLARRYTSAAVHICSRRYGGQLFSTTDQAGPRDPPARQPAPPIRAAVSASWRHYAAPRGGSLNLRRLASSSLRRDDGVISAQISGNTTAEAAGRPGTDPACGPGISWWHRSWLPSASPVSNLCSLPTPSPMLLSCRLPVPHTLACLRYTRRRGRGARICAQIQCIATAKAVGTPSKPRPAAVLPVYLRSAQS